MISPWPAHRLVGYFEEEAIICYSEYLDHGDKGIHPNIPAPQTAIDDWRLSPDARLRDLIIIIREDKRHHRDVNHGFAKVLAETRGTD